MTMVLCVFFHYFGSSGIFSRFHISLEEIERCPEADAAWAPPCPDIVGSRFGAAAGVIISGVTAACLT